MRKLTGGFRVYSPGSNVTGVFSESSIETVWWEGSVIGRFALRINLDNSLYGNPTSYENRVASVTALFLISY